MQRASYIKLIKALPEGCEHIGDMIWEQYYQGDLRQQIQENHQKTIDEFKDIIKSVSNNIDYRNFKKNKTSVAYALEKKRKPINQLICSIFHPQYNKCCSQTHYGGKHLTSLDMFVGNMEDKFLVFTLFYKDRSFLNGACQHVWKPTPKRNFIIKYLFYTFTQEYWLRNTCPSKIKKTNSRCSSWLKPNCSRCGNHKFKWILPYKL